jgi:hypothetical protein
MHQKSEHIDELKLQLQSYVVNSFQVWYSYIITADVQIASTCYHQGTLQSIFSMAEPALVQPAR